MDVFSIRDRHSCYLAFDLAFDSDSFVDMVVVRAVFAVSEIQTYFANGVITFWPSRTASDHSKRNRDSAQRPHRFVLSDPIATACRVDRNRAHLSRKLSVDPSPFACDHVAVRFSKNIPNPERQAKPEIEFHKLFVGKRI